MVLMVETPLLELVPLPTLKYQLLNLFRTLQRLIIRLKSGQAKIRIRGAEFLPNQVMHLWLPQSDGATGMRNTVTENQL
jgi:hypothetical protein